ncbi:MAG TPA: TPM domain-containing protein [Mycobacteriales bacterium]|nr:TPM domain-containing protein [Mycobacteriales bacterium]
MRALIVTAVAGVLACAAAVPAAAVPAAEVPAVPAAPAVAVVPAVVVPAVAPASVTAPATTAPRVTAPAGSAAYPAAATCVDTAGALSAATCARITAVLRADEKASPQRDQIAVAVVPTTGAASIEDWSTGLFNAWGVGQAGTDNGVLLVIALSDRALRIATGDGLRTRLPDGRASEIVGGTITPLLRAGRTEDAVLAGLDGIRTALGHDVSTTPLAAPGTRAADPLLDRPTTEDQDQDQGSGGDAVWLWVLLLAGIAVVGWVISLSRPDGGGSDDDGSYTPTRRRSYRSFGSSSSRRSSSSSSSRRSSGFGGGRSSGGGASGRW